MKTAGIIAEYNPFHNGHQYQIKTVRDLTGADYVIVAMSGDFLQRGIPAIADKYMRTRMALLGGADLVLELPAVWATASAEYFAAGGVQLLGKTGVVDTLCYGCETPDAELMQAIVGVLSKNTSDYQALVSSGIKQGNPFPVARSHALCSLLPSFPSDAVSAFLASPNNILALEYEKAIARWNSMNNVHDRALAGAPIQRIGEGYHSTKTGVTFASATAIRKALLSPPENEDRQSPFTDSSKRAAGCDSRLSQMLPKTSAALLVPLAQQHRLLDMDAFSSALYTRLWALQSKGYAGFADCGTDLSHRIMQQLEHFLSFSQFADLLKSKNTTYTRICRALLHILLGIRQEDYAALWQPDGVPYLRVLGFRKDSSALLSAIKKEASVPLITKVADASRLLPDAAYKRLQQDISCADLYRATAMMQSQMKLPNEYRQPIVIV